jgi:hypothetical protein
MKISEQRLLDYLTLGPVFVATSTSGFDHVARGARTRIRTLRHLDRVFLRWPPDPSFRIYVRLISNFGVAAAPLLLASSHVHRRLSARTWPLRHPAQLSRGAVDDPAGIGAHTHLLRGGGHQA